jgi:pyridoxal phosphate enzyme (YggS family)
MQIANHMKQDIEKNLIDIRDAIAGAARACGRTPDEVRLIAVSKTHPAEAITTAIAAGQRDFGESTAQEALTKIPRFRNQGLEWHFIGHLQSNKARFIPGNFAWLHSLDSPGLARKLSRLAQEQSANINILIEVNVFRDAKKHGVDPDALPGLVEQLVRENLPALNLRGLMTIGPHPATETEVRGCFARLRELRDECRRRFDLPRFSELSMGMSADYVEAIQEGSTMVRIGSAIFGARDYSRKQS